MLENFKQVGGKRSTKKVHRFASFFETSSSKKKVEELKSQREQKG